VQEKDQPPKVCDKIFESVLPVLFVDPSGHRLISANAAAAKILPPNVQFLTDIFETNQPEFDRVVTILTRFGPQQMILMDLDGGEKHRLIVFTSCAVEALDCRATDRRFDALPVPLLKLAPNGDLLIANEAARRLLVIDGVENVNLSYLMDGLGRSVNDWLHRSAFGLGQPQSEFLRLTRARSETFVQVTLSRILEQGVPQLFAVLTDATALKVLEAQFVQSQKMQAIGQLAGGVAHDFNNLLTAILGYCDLLLLRHNQTDADYADLIEVNQNANRAASLVDQLLAFSRKQTMRPEILDLEDVMSDLTHLLNRLLGEKVLLRFRQDRVTRHIRADRRQLEQVVMNLVVNARDAMPNGGDVTIETTLLDLKKLLERDRVSVALGAYVSVKVTDCGSGINADVLPHIFEPFYTTKRTGKGIGLGLSMVYGIVKQTGGYVFVDSIVGEGCCFTFQKSGLKPPTSVGKDFNCAPQAL
jgi:two-component system cell cycle sensor histidine kinase/response regulator CckA